MTGRHRPIFKPAWIKYALSYIALMAVLFTGISAYMYAYFNGAMRDKAVENSINKLSRIRYQQERYLSTLLDIADQMSLSPYIAPFKFRDEPWKAYKLLQQMKPYTVTTSFCDQMFLIFNNDDTLYSSASSMKLNLFLHNLMLFDETPPEELEALIRAPGSLHILKSQRVRSILLDGASPRMVTVITPLGISLSENIGTLIFMIKESTFHALFRDEVAQSSNTYIISGEQVIASGENFSLPQNDVLTAVNGMNGRQAVTIRYGGNDYLLAALGGQEFMAIRYCTVIPLSAIAPSVKSGLIGFFLVLTGLSFPCVLLIWFFTRSSYKPIRQLRSLFPAAQPSADDFGAIHKGIAELAAQNNNLSARLDESIPMRRASFILAFIKGRFQGKTDAAAAAAGLEMDINKKYFAVLLAGLSPQAGQGAVEALLAEPVPGTAICGTEIISLDQILLVLFADDKAALESWAEEIRRKATAGHEVTAVSISGIHDDFRAIKTAYLEANSAYDNRFVMGEARLLRFEDICGAARHVVPQARNYTDGIKQAMDAGNLAMVNARIDDLFAFLKRTEMSLFAFRMIYNDVIDAILSKQEEPGASEDMLRYYDVFTLSGCRSIDDLDNILRNLCDRLVSHAKPPMDGTPVIREAAEYINTHFSDPSLSMSEVAGKLGLSTARLSLDFKENMHMSPSDYLLLLRMEKSKELLGTTKISIKDVCAAAGYYDASGFIRRFKQYTAVTPLQYRQNIQKGGRADNAQG
jgi:two-component system, response regulator YesN